MNPATDVPTGLRLLAGALPTLEAPDFVAGRWHDPERLDDGSLTMPWCELGAAAEAFVGVVGQSGLMMIGFDWPTWASTPEAVALRTDRETLATATPEQLRKLLTMLIREDRFNEGALCHSFESGLMKLIARRANALSVGDVT